MVSPPALRALWVNKFMEQSVIALDSDNAKDGMFLMGEPVSGMGTQGTGGPWWILVIAAVVVLMLVGCCGVVVYRHKKKLQQEKEGNDSLGEPLFVDNPSIA